MKRINTYLLAALPLLLAVACQTEYTTYSDAERVMFADTLSTHMVQQDRPTFHVKVASTVARDYDRTLAVEVIDRGSNAIEGRHYRLRSNTITIPAGEMTGHVEVEGLYDNIEATDSLGFVLQLVMPEELKWEGLYPNHTKVVMYKSCPYLLEDFEGWCVVTSMFLNSYPGSENKSMQRLVYTERHPEKENTLIFHNWLFTGYDIEASLDPSDPAEPRVHIAEGQVLSDEISVFGITNGDNRILVTESPYNNSYFNSCQRYMQLWILAYVENLGDMVGTVGQFFHVMEWVSDEEADRLAREEGLIKRM